MVFDYFKKKKAQKDKIKEFIVWGLRYSIVLILGWALLYGEWESFSISLLALFLTFIPIIVSKKTKIELPVEFDLVMVLFIYLSVVLGSALGAYYSFPWWDSMLHIASGVVLSYGGFLILYLLYLQKKLKASPIVIAIFTFTFGIALSAIWEVYEFAADHLFGLDMQRNRNGDGLVDTMWDLIVALIGSLIMALMAYWFLNHKKAGYIVGWITNRFIETNPKYKKKWWQI